MNHADYKIVSKEGEEIRIISTTYYPQVGITSIKVNASIELSLNEKNKGIERLRGELKELTANIEQLNECRRVDFAKMTEQDEKIKTLEKHIMHNGSCLNCSAVSESAELEAENDRLKKELQEEKNKCSLFSQSYSRVQADAIQTRDEKIGKLKTKICILNNKVSTLKNQRNYFQHVTCTLNDKILELTEEVEGFRIKMFYSKPLATPFNNSRIKGSEQSDA